MFTIFSFIFTCLYYICIVAGFPLSVPFWLLLRLDGFKITYKDYLKKLFIFGIELFKEFKHF